MLVGSKLRSEANFVTIPRTWQTALRTHIGSTGPLPDKKVSQTNKPATKPLAIPLRTSANWRLLSPVEEHARAHKRALSEVSSTT
jgi:hypothetical protein